MAFIQQAELPSAVERCLIAMDDPFFITPVRESVVEPNQRLIDLLTKPGKLSALEWREVEILTGDDL